MDSNEDILVKPVSSIDSIRSDSNQNSELFYEEQKKHSDNVGFENMLDEEKRKLKIKKLEKRKENLYISTLEERLKMEQEIQNLKKYNRD